MLAIYLCLNENAKIMKTYIMNTFANKGFVATTANNKNHAICKAQAAGHNVIRTSIQISAVNIDFVTGCTKVA